MRMGDGARMPPRENWLHTKPFQNPSVTSIQGQGGSYEAHPAGRVKVFVESAFDEVK